MNPGPPLGDAGPAGRRGAEATSTPTTLAPEPPDSPRERQQHKGWRRIVRCLFFPCTAGQGEDEDEDENEGQGATTPRHREQQQEQKDEGEEAREANGPPRSPPKPSDPLKRPCSLKAIVQKLLAHELLHRHVKMKKVQQQEEAEGKITKEGEVVVAQEGENREEEEEEEEEVQEAEGKQRRRPSFLGPCSLSCCCLLAFLLLVAVYGKTSCTDEPPRQCLTPTQLRQDSVVAAALMVTAAWSLFNFSAPSVSKLSEVLLLVFLALTNACLVLLTKAVLAAYKPLSYCCSCWVLGILVPFFLLVFMCSLAMMRA